MLMIPGSLIINQTNTSHSRFQFPLDTRILKYLDWRPSWLLPYRLTLNALDFLLVQLYFFSWESSSDECRPPLVHLAFDRKKYLLTLLETVEIDCRLCIILCPVVQFSFTFPSYLAVSIYLFFSFPLCFVLFDQRMDCSGIGSYPKVFEMVFCRLYGFQYWYSKIIYYFLLV